MSHSVFFHALMEQDALPLEKVLWAKKLKVLRSPAVEQPGDLCSPAGLMTKPFISHLSIWEMLAWFVAGQWHRVRWLHFLLPLCSWTLFPFLPWTSLCLIQSPGLRNAAVADSY